MILQGNKITLDLMKTFSDIEVRLTLEMPNDDASGKTSSTETLNGGVKPKKLSVSCTLPMRESKSLTKLIKMAESVEKDGNRSVYTVSDETADAADIREVIFHDRLDVRKRDNLLAWQISFTLREHKSVPEVKEQRSTPSSGSATAASAAGAEVKSNAEVTSKGPLYDMLKSLDEYLAPIVNGSGQ